MRSLVQGHDHTRFPDLDRRGDVQQVAEDRLGLGRLRPNQGQIGRIRVDDSRHQALTS